MTILDTLELTFSTIARERALDARLAEGLGPSLGRRACAGRLRLASALQDLALLYFRLFATQKLQLPRRGVSFRLRFGNKIIYLRGRQQPPAPPFGTFRNTVPARTVRNVPGERTA